MATRMAKKMLDAKRKEIAKAPKRKAVDEVIVEDDGNALSNKLDLPHLNRDYIYDAPVISRKVKKAKLDFQVSREIEQSAIISTYDPKADGWCGFRVFGHLLHGHEDQFPLVKARMLDGFQKYQHIYADGFRFDVAELEKIIRN
ncbi:hypothetical protein DFQ28_010526 [Apophysomyces sp. BC1034]|nr:hypothetical protein DFQ30_010150 [Apophysomyces sp. BC1015]KAG0171081.1 hypothetical protein DFQ29_008992 [Apophysomyces sp. BC1021]KAG0184771.1 hypothetical protein DFQ28_010526 [Apophysomyces sp. BC1034]